MSCLYSQENIYPLDSKYTRFDEIEKKIREIVDLNQEIARWEIIGFTSNENLPMYAIKISDNVHQQEDNEAKILLCGPHQSEEVLGMEIVLNHAKQLVYGYNKDSQITKAVNSFEIWIVVNVNPEGLQIVSSGKMRLKRKNNTDTNWDGIYELDEGVDLNKNYPVNWEQDKNNYRKSPYYKGYKTASEREINSMISFFERQKFNFAFFYHSSSTGNFSERIFYPWKWKIENNYGSLIQFSPDYDLLQELAKRISTKLPKDYEEGNYTVHTSFNFQKGYARDFIYKKFNTLPLTIEVGGNSSTGEGIISPSNSQLKIIKDKHFTALMEFFRILNSNLLKIKVVDKSNIPLENEEIFFSSNHKESLSPIKTNSEGYFFRLFFDEAKKISYIIRDKTLNVPFTKGKLEYLIQIDKTQNIKPVITNFPSSFISLYPDFQNFPPIKIDKAHLEMKVNISIMKGYKTYFSKEIVKENNFNLPWIPINKLKHSVLSISIKNQFNEIISSKKCEVNYIGKIIKEASFVRKISKIHAFYLQPNAKIAVYFPILEWTHKKIFIDGIKIYANSKDLSAEISVKIVTQNGNTEIQKKSIKKDRTIHKIKIKPIVFENAFVEIENISSSIIKIYRESSEPNNFISGNNYIYYNSWEKDLEEDFGIKLLLTEK